MRGSAAFRAAVAPGGVLAGPWVRNELWRRARAVPSLDLRFAENKSLGDAVTGQSLVTFTRASSGTYVGSDGLIKTATTNICLQSEDFSTTWAANNYILTSGFQSPSGTLTATKIARDSALATGAAISQNVNVASSTSYTFGCYLKAGELSKAAIREGASTGAYISVDLSTGTLLDENQIGSNYVITPVGDGWYRVAFTITSTVSQTSFGCRIYALPDSYTTGLPIFSWAGDDTSGIYIWGAQLEQSSTVGEYVKTTSTINSAPRFDHDPTTGESLGLLVEEQRTNSIRNNTMVGAVAGTPGTLPTNWSTLGFSGLTREVVGSGTTNGINYIDIKYSGTSSGTFGNLNLDASTAIVGANSQTWSSSGWFQVVSGSTSGINSIAFSLQQRDSGGAYLADTANGVASAIGTAFQRISRSHTTNNSSTAFVRPYLQFSIINGATIDFTLRIGMPQLEQGAFATSVIPTTASAATRAADVASITGTNFNTAQFARASTATFYNSSGIITTANVDIPRNNYNPTTLVAEGLLLEPQRQNLLLHSEDVDQQSLVNVTSSLDATTAPDNATTADEIAPTAVTGEHYVGYSANVTAGKTYTFSAYVKPNGAPAVRLRFALAGFNNEAGWHEFATNTTAPGSVGLRVIAIQNGWYRIEGTAVAAATALGSPRIYPNTVNNWLGVPAEAMYVWGAQLEEGADATSYIPTTTTEVTRSADVPAVSPWYRQDEGTLFALASRPTSITQNNRIVVINDGTINNRAFDIRQDSSTAGFALSNTAGSLDMSIGIVYNGTDLSNKLAVAQELNNANVAYNGTLGVDDTSVLMPSVDRMEIGSLTGAGFYGGHISRLTYWPRRLPNSTLQAITQ